MKIYPTIEIMGGQAVDRRDGSDEPPRPFDKAPLEAAKEFARAGPEALHVVDVDGTLQGGRHNADAIREIIDHVAVPVQVSGGIRTTETAEWWFEHGAARICLGTAAVKDRRLVQQCCASWPGRVLVNIAARGDRVVIEGWREETMFSPIELAQGFQETGIAEIVFVDLDRDANPQEHSLARTMRLGEALAIPVVTSGTVRSLDDVAILRHLPIDGCIIGRALMTGAIDLAEAIETATQPYHPPQFL